MNEMINKASKETIEAWRDLKFGMFIHWGLYSVLGRGEWAMFNEQIDKDEYRKLKDEFKPDKFNASEWAETAKKAGMKYMVLTARHHDGFCLWDSKSSVGDFTSVNSAAQKDFIKDYTDACREKGLKTGIYYSPMDWRFPAFFLPNLYKKNALELREQCHNQLKELMTDYGKIDILWFDGGEDFWLAHGVDMVLAERPADYKKRVQWEDFWKSGKLNDMIRALQPGIITNDRLGLTQYGDYTSPEKKIGAFDTVHPWETCETVAGDWGYRPNSRIRSLRSLIGLLVNVVVAGGNLLLNVGPRPDGKIEPDQVKRLEEVGKWLEKYGESIYKTRGGPFKCESFGGTVNKDNVLYIHITDWQEECISLPDKGNPKVECLTTDKFNEERKDGKIILSVEETERQAIDTIFKLTYNEKVTDLFEDGASMGSKTSYRAEALIIDTS